MCKFHYRSPSSVFRGAAALGGIFFALFGALRVHAQDITYSSDYFAVLPGYAMPSKAYGLTGTGVTISGIYGHQVAKNFSVEVNAQSSTFETGISRGTDFYQNGGTFDLTYALFDRRAAKLLTPFVLLGAGVVYDDFYPNNRDGAAFLAEAGVGVVSRPFFSDRIRLRFDARYTHDGKEGGHPEGRLIAGLEIPLGSIEHHVDYLPGKVEVREVVREVAPAAPIDSDGDGVDDAHDQCPNTPAGMKVNSVGCVIENPALVLHGVTFETNTARLTPNALTILEPVARAFVGQPTLKAEIAGYTDSIGSVKVNRRLSQRRADAVMAYLISANVRPDQLVAHGYGKSPLLIKPEVNEHDRERNRRVELHVLAQ